MPNGPKHARRPVERDHSLGGGESAQAAPVRHLTRQEIAKKIGVSTRSLDRWALDGGGPPFWRTPGGLPRYPEDLAEEWARARLVSSTSQAFR